jgi:D-hydroxyproline dehydrogenase subunit gamma
VQNVFRPLSADPGEATVSFEFDGEVFQCAAGTSLAAAILCNTDAAFRETPVSGSPRAAFCMMGACFECLVEVDGVENKQACMTVVQDGMRVRRMLGSAGASIDASAADADRASTPTLGDN